MIDKNAIARAVSLRADGKKLTDIGAILKVEFGGSWGFDRVRDILRRHGKRSNLESCQKSAEREPLDGDKKATFSEGACDALGYSNKWITTAADALAFFELSPEDWECVTVTPNVWQSQVAGGERLNLYQIKATFKTRRSDIADARSEIAELVAEAKKSMPRFKRRVTPKSNRLAIISLADLHIDKLADPDTCWHESGFDSMLGVLERAVVGLTERVSREPLDAIWFPLGNDLFNSDKIHDKVQTTAGGTPQHSDLRWREVFRQTRRLVCRLVSDVLGEVAPVFVPVIAGNHDESKCFYLGDVLEVWAEGKPNIKIDNTGAFRKYYAWRNCLFGLTHGDKVKPREANAMMSQEAAHLWKPRQWREFLTGHFHKDALTGFKVSEQEAGVFWRVLPSLCKADEWHTRMGFIGSIPAGLGLVYEGDGGLSESHTWTDRGK